MRFGSLFAGIGGLDLGLERAGHVCAWQVELDPYCQAVLREHWPHVPKYPDVRTVGDELERVNLVCGGFPCQPVSLAGRRRGAADERWLWPELARVLRLLRPRYALLENVPGLLAGGGMAEVLGDLASLGFDAEWDCIPAAAVGAPHLRYRVFIVAYAQRDELRDESGRRDGPRWSNPSVAGDDGANWHVADPSLDGRRPRWSSDGAQGQRGRQPDRGGIGASVADADRAERWSQPEARHESNGHDAGRLETPGRSWLGGEAIPAFGWWESEPDVGRVAHGVPSRVDRLRALGNAVVPQVAEVIGRRLAALVLVEA